MKIWGGSLLIVAALLLSGCTTSAGADAGNTQAATGSPAAPSSQPSPSASTTPAAAVAPVPLGTTTHTQDELLAGINYQWQGTKLADHDYLNLIYKVCADLRAGNPATNLVIVPANSDDSSIIYTFATDFWCTEFKTTG